MFLVEKDPLLVVGQTYLFTTGRSDTGGWNTLVPGYGDVIITNALMEAKIVAEFKEAFRTEIPLKLQQPVPRVR